jgi:hypothetical protein
MKLKIVVKILCFSTKRPLGQNIREAEKHFPKHWRKNGWYPLYELSVYRIRHRIFPPCSWYSRDFKWSATPNQQTSLSTIETRRFPGAPSPYLPVCFGCRVSLSLFCVIFYWNTVLPQLVLLLGFLLRFFHTIQKSLASSYCAPLPTILSYNMHHFT